MVTSSFSPSARDISDSMDAFLEGLKTLNLPSRKSMQAFEAAADLLFEGVKANTKPK